MKVSEPAIAYNTPCLQGLKNRLIIAIDESRDEEKLQECLELLHVDDMPCVFTDKEFKRELEESEASGDASDEEVKAVFAKWGL